MINNVEMLNYIRQNVEMGIHGITHILDKVSDDRLKTALEDQRREYGKIYGAADKAIRQLGHQPVHVDKIAKIGSDMSTVFKTMADGSDSKIAEMMIQGNTMGAIKIMRKLGSYDGDSRDIHNLANKLLDTEQSNIDQMKQFL